MDSSSADDRSTTNTSVPSASRVSRTHAKAKSVSRRFSHTGERISGNFSSQKSQNGLSLPLRALLVHEVPTARGLVQGEPCRAPRLPSRGPRGTRRRGQKARARTPGARQWRPRHPSPCPQTLRERPVGRATPVAEPVKLVAGPKGATEDAHPHVGGPTLADVLAAFAGADSTGGWGLLCQPWLRRVI